jgi:Kdo2-lipid IVA 3' secondary acyltransferase
MSDAPVPTPAEAAAPLLHRALGALGALTIRVVGRTLRYRFDDRGGVFQLPANEGIIWSFWHNRLFLMSYLHRRFFSHRAPGAGMTSQSKDGEWAAQLVLRFGISPVRGSAARGGTAALRKLARFLRRGEDVGITPDGSRGPRYELKPGLVLLAQLSGRPILPVGVEYSRCLRLKSWDGFMIPLPFSRVDVILGNLVPVAITHSPEDFEAERRRCEEAMMALVKRR